MKSKKKQSDNEDIKIYPDVQPDHLRGVFPMPLPADPGEHSGAMNGTGSGGGRSADRK